jgi:hypothetical protein
VNWVTTRDGAIEKRETCGRFEISCGKETADTPETNHHFLQQQQQFVVWSKWISDCNRKKGVWECTS